MTGEDMQLKNKLTQVMNKHIDNVNYNIKNNLVQIMPQYIVGNEFFNKLVELKIIKRKYIIFGGYFYKGIRISK